eukprot:1038911-Rhodomonas_salina.2
MQTQFMMTFGEFPDNWGESTDMQVLAQPNTKPHEGRRCARCCTWGRHGFVPGSDSDVHGVVLGRCTRCSTSCWCLCSCKTSFSLSSSRPLSRSAKRICYSRSFSPPKP